MLPEEAEALAAFRRFNYDQVYMRPASVAQADAVIGLLRALVEYYSDRPNLLPNCEDGASAGGADAQRAAVAWVSGMTDRYACRQGIALLGWERSRLPQGIDTP